MVSFPCRFTTDPSRCSTGIIIKGKLMSVYSAMDAWPDYTVPNRGDGSGGESIAWRTPWIYL